MAEYVKGSRDKVSYAFHGSISGNNINVGGYKATQIAASQGIDAGGLSLLMQAVIEALPSLNLSPGNQEDAKYAAGQVVSEVQDPRPDHSRLRAALRALQSALISSTQQALAAVLRAVIDHELTRVGLPPGG